MPPMKTKAKTRVRKTTGPTVAVHGQTADGTTHVVGIGNLRVLISQDDGWWIAQGLEVDYTAQGASVDDAKVQFERGFHATVHEHLRLFGSIDGFLRVAPQEIWAEFYGHCQAGEQRLQFTQVALHHLPDELRNAVRFDGIQFLKRQAAGADAVL